MTKRKLGRGVALGGTPVTAWFIDRGEGDAARTYLAFQA